MSRSPKRGKPIDEVTKTDLLGFGKKVPDGAMRIITHARKKNISVNVDALLKEWPQAGDYVDAHVKEFKLEE